MVSGPWSVVSGVLLMVRCQLSDGQGSGSLNR
jgi:hypothetical protein